MRYWVIFIVMKRTIWNENDTTLLKEYYSISTNSELLSMFPNRTIFAIMIKAKKLHLKKSGDAEKKNRSAAHQGKKNGMFGKSSKIKGKTYDQVYGVEKSNSIKHQLKEKAAGRKGMAGEKNPMYGRIAHNKGVPQSEDVKMATSNLMKVNWSILSQIEKDKRLTQLTNARIKCTEVSNKDTKPEQICETYIVQQQWRYSKKTQIDYYNCDFVINDNLVVEVQGDYWHGNPRKYSPEKLSTTQKNNIRRDKSKLTYLTNKGYTVLYLWEYDIIHNIDECVKQLNNFVNGNNF